MLDKGLGRPTCHLSRKVASGERWEPRRPVAVHRDVSNGRPQQLKSVHSRVGRPTLSFYQGNSPTGLKEPLHRRAGGPRQTDISQAGGPESKF